MRYPINNKKGSSTIMLAMIFVTIAMCITASIALARAVVVKSECESFGHVWTRAILSEYDVHLLKEYNILAYWGNEAEVKRRIDTYLNYSSKNRLAIAIKDSSSALSGYELSIPDNFRKAVENSMDTNLADSILNDNKRKIAVIDDKAENRVIRNHVVLDTLPSERTGASFDSDNVIEQLDTKGYEKKLAGAIRSCGAEMLIVRKYFNNHCTDGDGKKGFFQNEWEYILNGAVSDDENNEKCRKRMFLIRNGLNLAYIYSDPEKVELITTVAECLSPGVAGVLTQAVLAEVWAAAETEKDLDILYENGRVPFVKTSASWHTDLKSILKSDKIMKELDDEGRKLLEENMDSFDSMKGASGHSGNNEKGQSYDDYLLAMMLTMDRNIRTLRIMDLIQINMKYWYYRDFNMMEYYTGVRFSINANGKNYVFEDCYK